MSRTILPRYRQIPVLLSLGFSLTAPSDADAQTSASALAGRWRGRWADVTGAQWGTLDIVIGRDGAMSGVITNTTVAGSWAGTIANDGVVSATYRYPSQQFSAVAEGKWGVDNAGQLVGHLEFLSRGQMFGKGALALARVPSIQNAGSVDQVPLCAIYPTLCGAPAGPVPTGPFELPGFPGVQPVFLPGVEISALPMAVQSGLGALPPEVRQALFSPQLAEAVRSGDVDRRIADVLGGSVVPLLNFINGGGPGGAAHTNQAAWRVLTGDSPVWQLGAALSPYALPLDRLSACRAVGTC